MSAKKTNGKTNGASNGTHAGPPYGMTIEQATEMLARHRFQPANVEHEIDKCASVLDDIANEVTALAESITDAVCADDGSHNHADALMAYARALGDVSARMMRYTGRLEAYRDAQGHARKADEMIEAWKSGGLGNPAPDIEVGRTARRMQEAAGMDGAE